ncbi:MAG: hypothetical protein IJZ35_02100 [Clostridia bacterium]|nr:hypothetical protein [Clostridia bacterium]
MTDKELFSAMLFHDDKNSNYIIQKFKPKSDKIYEVVKAKDFLDTKLSSDEDVYITINGFCGISRKTDECRQINALFFDLDCHCKYTKEVGWGVEHTYLSLKDAIEENRLKKPNLIINTGRGLHLYYIFEKSIPYRLTDKSVNEKGLKIRESIINSISDDIQAVLKEANCVLELDTKVSDISRIARIPGTKNTTARKVTKIIDYDEDYYTFEELLKTNKKKPAPKKKIKNNEFGQALHTIRLAELEKLQEYRNFDCRGCREYMCFVYYNAAVQVFDRETAYNKLVAFRNKFDDARAVPNSQLKALSACIDRNKGSDYEGFYKLTKDWIIQNLAITPDEIAELGLFKLSKQELKKQQNKIDKQAQAMQVIELAANGMKHQTIADTVGISKRKTNYKKSSPKIEKNQKISVALDKQKLNAFQNERR